jgi:Mn2+/Fe2+ NRAMP family transporter
VDTTENRLTPIEYPEPLAELRSRFNVLRYFGPGAIIAATTIGSGETLFASQTGAIFGYALGWFIIICVATKCIQVYTAARYMTLTGEHPIESWVRLPGPRGWFPWFMAILSIFCFPFWLAGLNMMLGTLINWIFGMSVDDPRYLLYARCWGTGFMVLAITLTVVQPYAVLEKVQTCIVGILLLSVMVSVFASPTDWSQALTGFFVVRIPAFEDWLVQKYPAEVAHWPVIVVMVTFMGAIGGGTYDYLGYLGLYREKDWAALGLKDDPAACANLEALQERRIAVLPISESNDNRRRVRAWLRAPLIDVCVSFLAVLLFTLAFTLLGATILHPQHIVPAGLNLLSEQSRFLTQLGHGFKYLYQLGVLMAFWGTIYGAYEIYTRTGYECLRSISNRIRHTPISKIRPWVLLYCGLGGFILMWSFKKPMDIVKPAALLGGAFLCGMWCFAMIYADRKFLPRFLRMPGWLLVLNILAGITLSFFGGKACYDFIASLAQR